MSRAMFAPLPICLLAFAGCKPAIQPVVAASSTSSQLTAAVPNRSSAHISVQSDACYQEAVRLYATGNRSGAAAIIDKLLSSTALSAPDRTFLERQKALCSSPVATAVGHGRRPAPLSGSLAHNAVSRPPAQDCGPRALKIILQQFGKDADLDQLREGCGTTEKGVSLDGLANAGRAHGLKAEGIQVNREALNGLKTPAIAWVSSNHYVAVLKVKDRRATIIDPNQGKIEDPYGEEVITTEELLRRSGGILLTVSR